MNIPQGNIICDSLTPADPLLLLTVIGAMGELSEVHCWTSSNGLDISRVITESYVLRELTVYCLLHPAWGWWVGSSKTVCAGRYIVAQDLTAAGIGRSTGLNKISNYFRPSLERLHTCKSVLRRLHDGWHCQAHSLEAAPLRRNKSK